MSIVRQVVMHNTEGSSDKLYRLTIEQNGSSYDVRAENCRRGQHYISQPNKATGTTLSQAQFVVDRTMTEKRRGGYKVTEDSTPASRPAASSPAPAAAAKPVPGNPGSFKPGFKDLPLAKGTVAPAVKADSALQPTASMAITTGLPGLLNDPETIIFGVRGGIRMAIGKWEGRCFAVGKDGMEQTLPGHLARVINQVAQLHDDNIHLEGELMPDGVFIAWDILDLGHRDLRELGYADRYFEMAYLLCGGDEGPRKVIKPVFMDDSTDKVPFFLMLQDERSAGVEFRSRNASLLEPEGQPRSFTFTKEARFIVLGKCGDGRKLEIGLHPINSGDRYHDLPVEWRGMSVEATVPLGFVDLPAGAPAPRIGAVIRVAYEVVTPGTPAKGTVFQGIEADADEAGCTMAQLV